ncbi:hypothetical protein [Streptomyces aureus]|uniref:hypothetical protein n=1 Tax=Streptomyces aureus TaxID=193461 RepID=UPI0034051512
MLKKSLVALAAMAAVVGTAGAAQADDVVRVVQGASVPIPVSSGGYPGTAAAVAGCADGETRVGGGAVVTAGNSHSDRYNLSSSVPISGERWWAFATNTDTANPGTLQAYAICAKVVKTSVLTTP